MPRIRIRDQFTAEQRKAMGVHFIDRNTTERKEGNETIIRLHNTDIVRKFPDGSVILNSGGYQTVTTKDRMNKHMPAGVRLFQERGQWWLGSTRDEYLTKLPYFEGVAVPQCFNQKGQQAKAARAETAAKVLRKKIKLFCDKLDGLKELPAPSLGDCFFCQALRTQSEIATEVSVSHLHGHVKEGYLHGSLLLNAIKWAGYQNPAALWQMENYDRQHGRRLHGGGHVKRALRRYLQRKLGLAQ